jgi:hypothetical protein
MYGQLHGVDFDLMTCSLVAVATTLASLSAAIAKAALVNDSLRPIIGSPFS